MCVKPDPKLAFLRFPSLFGWESAGSLGCASAADGGGLGRLVLRDFDASLLAPTDDVLASFEDG